jgi:hypothetical protein
MRLFVCFLLMLLPTLAWGQTMHEMTRLDFMKHCKAVVVGSQIELKNRRIPGTGTGKHNISQFKVDNDTLSFLSHFKFKESFAGNRRYYFRCIVDIKKQAMAVMALDSIFDIKDFVMSPNDMELIGCENKGWGSEGGEGSSQIDIYKEDIDFILAQCRKQKTTTRPRTPPPMAKGSGR